MRLFIFNNGALKYILIKDFKTLSAANSKITNLGEVFNPLIEANFINNQADPLLKERKKGLWTTAMLSLKRVKLDNSKKVLITETSPGLQTYFEQAISSGSKKAYFDFYLDRGNGWVGFAKNYQLCGEVDKKGNIDSKYSLITSPASDYLWKKRTYSSTINQVLLGNSSIMPIGIGQYYGQGSGRELSLDHFRGLVEITNKMTMTLLSIFRHEWPALIFDAKQAKLLDTKESVKTTFGLESEATAQLLIDKAGTAVGSTKGYDYTALDPALVTQQLKDYLVNKLVEVEKTLLIYYRQMKFLTNSSFFHNEGLSKEWYQAIWSGFLWLAGQLALGLVNYLADLGKQDAGKEGSLPQLLGDFILNKQKQYSRGGSKVPINQAIDSMSDILMTSYISLELFLKEWGLCKPVTGRTQTEIQAKLDKIKKALEPKKSNLERLS